MRQDSAAYRRIFLDAAPLLDTRAPVEFARGAFPGAVNLPLLDDAEREQVGICYRQQGQAAAIKLGTALVSGARKARRLQAWCEFARQYPGGYLYCFRGGLRSQTAQAWLRAAGVEYPLIRGGYKALRRFLLEALANSLGQASPILVAGRTGTGKTLVIKALQRAIDLEALARHRGSSFGYLLDPQPGQIDFENSLSIALLRLLQAGSPQLALEDEGAMIGRVSLPPRLCEMMRQAPLWVVEEPMARRVDVIFSDYVRDLGGCYAQHYGNAGAARHRQQLVQALERIRKRLGGERYQRIDQTLRAAFAARGSAAETLHRQWIHCLLLEYYDPMYDYQIGRRQGSVLARGSRADITALAQAQLGVRS